jgi:Spy/CpxP family protein refolding chaperone
VLGEIRMSRISLIVAAALVATLAATPASAQSKYSPMKLKEMKANWSKNKGKYKDCRAQVKTKGLAGDDRWFFI